MIKKYLFIFIWLSIPWVVEGKPPELTPTKAKVKIEEMLEAHAFHKELTTQLIERITDNYLNELDPLKSYFIEEDIAVWLNPSLDQLQAMLSEFKRGNYQQFRLIYERMLQAIERRNQLEESVANADLPKGVTVVEFQNMKWAQGEEDLLQRLIRMRGLQIETAAKLRDDQQEKTLKWIAKRQGKFEEEFLKNNPAEGSQFFLSKVLKATASSLDTHTHYFTPDEAAQFLISVEQRLFGIGVLMRDDLNGFAVAKIVPGGPAAKGGELQVGDRIIAVDGEPVMGMDIEETVGLIRGQENTTVVLTVMRQEQGDERRVEIPIARGEVLLEESRYQSSYEPFGDGIIVYLKLSSFYQDPQSSSATDLEKELKKYQKNHHIRGVVVDLRYNSGGLLSQAVEVTGLFISKGIVVSIKDNAGHVQHLRDVNPHVTWNGPLVVLVNRASASASEIVAQALQDYGRAIVVGDDHTYGKGSFQTFTLNPGRNNGINEEGEYKVTRGRYYTVSGKTPQLTGVAADLIVPGGLFASEIGEKYAKYPLDGDRIKANFDDDLSDIPLWQRGRIKMLYRFNLQPRLTSYVKHLDRLRENSIWRIESNQNYSSFLRELNKESAPQEEQYGMNDLQLSESYNIIKDLIFLHSKDR